MIKERNGRRVRILFVKRNIDYVEPFAIMYLSSFIKAKGYHTKLVALSRNIEKEVRDYSPSVIAYSVMTGEEKVYLDINKTLKSRFRFISVFGGPHITFNPEFVLCEFVDAVVVGESEAAFSELLEAYKRGRWGNTALRNCLYKHVGKVVGSPDDIYSHLNKLIADLDSLPFPDRKIVYDASTILRDIPIKSFMTGRGCPYNCTYCFNSKYNEIYQNNRIRRYSPEYVVEEIIKTREAYNLKFVKFMDDIFALRTDSWIEEFCKLYGNKVKLPFQVHLRTENVSRELLTMLKSAGLNTVSMAIEAGNEIYRCAILNRNMSDKQILKAFDECNRLNIRTLTENILGLPGTDMRDEMKTLQLNIDAKPTLSQTSIFIPYPKLPLTDYAIRIGSISSDFMDFPPSFCKDSVLNFPKSYKRILHNLSLCFPFIVTFPKSRKILLKLIKRKYLSLLFFMICFFHKSFMLNRYIYPAQWNFSLRVRVFFDGLKREYGQKG